MFKNNKHKPQVEGQPAASSSKKSGKQKKLQIRSTQMFSPVRDVRDGIVVTKDKRYIKIMEFTPVNLELRSASERDLIISAFAAALKIMPTTVQMKVVTRRAETQKYTDQIIEDLQNETCQNVRDLAAERADLIEETALNGGVTRRFFLIFEYEETNKELGRKTTWADIRNHIFYQASLIANALSACGNVQIQPDDAEDVWTMEVLYSILCRGESEKKPFKNRMYEVFARYANCEKNDEEAYIPVNNFICPQRIDTQLSPNYICVDGLYQTYLFVLGSSYDVRAAAGWSRLFIDMGEGIDVDIFIHKEPEYMTQQKLQFKIRSNKLQLKDQDDTSMDYEETAMAMNAGYYLRQGMANGEEFCYFGVFLTVSAPSLKEMQRKASDVRNRLRSYSITAKTCMFHNQEAMLMMLPLCKPDPGLFRKARRNALTSSLASIYPYLSAELADEDGVLMGTNVQSRSIVMLNNFDTSRYENANFCILGTTGAGKTFTLMNMLMRYRAKGIQVFAIIPKKGDEFLRAAEYNGGQYINLSPGSMHNINVLDIRKLDNTTKLLLDGETALGRSRREAKIDQVRTFFKLILHDITPEELETVDEALKITYTDFGITEDNESLWDPDRPGEYRKMPLLGDLYERLVQMGDDAKRVAKVLRRYVEGSAKSFNRPTNVNLDNKFIVFDLNDLTEEMLPIGIFIALDYIWDKIREDKTVRKVVALDEVWALLRGGAGSHTGAFLMEIIKTIRAFGGAAITASQDLRDFFAYKDGEYGKAIISGSRCKFIMKLDDTEADFVADTLHLTKSESDQIREFGRGTGLLIAHKDHVTVQFQATPTEFELCNTDRKALAAQAEEKARILQDRSGAAEYTQEFRT